MQKPIDLTDDRANCDENKYFSFDLIQNDKLVNQIIYIYFRVSLEDIEVFSRHDAFYKEIKI